MTEQKKFDTDKILAETNLVELVSRYVELKPKGREYVGLCIEHADTNPSMYVVPDKGFVHCMSCGFHQNAIGFLMYMEQIEFVPACKRLTGEDKSLPDPKPVAKRILKKAPSRRTFAPPAGTPAPDMELKGLGQPTHTWTYRTITGEVMGYVTRYAETDRKEIRCWSWGNRADHEPASWACGHFSEPRPLYGQEKLRNAGMVVIAEGEKTADAAQLLFPQHVVMSWPGGAQAVHKADWSILKGRTVFLIPDNDEAGRQAMERIAAYLYENGAEKVKGVEVETLPDGSPTPKGWDLADAEGWTPESTKAWANSRILTYPNISPESPTAAPEPMPATQDTAKPAPTQPTPAKSKPDLGVVDGNTVRKPRIATGIEAEAELPPEFSEFGMAESWVTLNMDDWRYTTRSKEWRLWNGNHWELDQTDKVRSSIKSHIVKLNADSRDLTPTQRNRVCTWKTAENVKNICASDQRIAVTPMQWDSDPLLLGTPAGTVDLKTGEIRPTTPDDMITKTTAVSPEPGPHPWWDMVLERAHKGNAETADFIQRWCGYMLTGDTREEKFLLIHGAGGGGKSKFLSPLKELMGEYHKLASFETFTTVGNNRGSVDEWARLSGARLVTASEPEEGARWREGAIKQATGRDGMTARHMYQSTFDYMPQFKLVFMGNHKPQLRSIGEEMRRRIDLLEWSGSIPQDQRIADLPDRLRVEYPAILAWMIQGAMMWQARGLGRPEVVAANTSEYMESEDVLGQWIDDCVELADGAFTLSSGLYESFSKWCEDNGEYCAPMRRFSLKMEERGFIKHRKTSGRGFLNVQVKMP